MFRKKLCVVFLAFLLLQETVQGKKSRKNRHPKPEEEDHTPQPSVVSYSTFGFNDVGTYEGFVPSSPDYAKFLSGANQESTTKTHSSGFPTSVDSNDFGNSFSSQPYNGQSFSMNNDGGLKASMVQYPQTSVGLFNTPTFDTNVDQHGNIAAEEVYGRNTEDVNTPTYGTKINSRNKIRSVFQYNNTDFTGPSGIQNDEKLSNVQEVKQTFESRPFQEAKPPFESRPFQETKPPFENRPFHEARPTFENRPFHETKATIENRPAHSESINSFYNTPSYPSTSIADYNKPVSSDNPNQVKFQRVVDFTKSKQYYPTELDTSRLPTATPIPDLYENNDSNQNLFMNAYDINENGNKNLFSPASKHKDAQKQNYNNEYTFEKNAFKANNIKEDFYNFSGYTNGKDNLLISNSDLENKKTKIKPWSSGGHHFKKWKEPSPSKGYEYSTNYSSMSFSYDADKDKFMKPLGSSIDELIPASSNIDTPNYHFPETDFSSFKKMPEYKVQEEDEYANFPSFKEASKITDFEYNQYKYLYSTTPTTTSHWGNALKPSGYSSLKSYPITNKYKYRDNDEVVNIPRRPNRLNYENPFESKPNEWPQYIRRPYKNRPYKDWDSDVPTTRFKSEEDLLGLRNQDTSHPSYLPSYQSNNFASDEIDYKKIVDKWRQSYLKSKFKDSFRDHESFGTETKAKHVPVPKPYPIEVPHPVIVPVPQPYPIRVPIAKPVAVPVIRELKIPIEKPMPYVVYKDVPYPIEKLVPVPVEKEVPVPVVKPYPVHIPYIRPVFHHTKSRDEYDSEHRDHRDDDDYMPRQESKHKYSQYKKKIPNGTRNRSRRPSRTAYQDRNRRRWPDRRRPADMRDDLPRTRPIELHHPSPFKRRDSETTRFKDEPSNYFFNV